MSNKKHSVEVVENALPVDEYLSWHERGWVVQRFGWGFTLLIPLLGALGMFGDGFLSNKKLEAAGVKVQYEKFGRFQKEMAIEIQSQDGHISSIALPQAYLASFSNVRLTPEPKGNHTGPGTVVYHFEGTDNRMVTLYAQPQKTGSIPGAVQVGTQRLLINHFIYP